MPNSLLTQTTRQRNDTLIEKLQQSVPLPHGGIAGRDVYRHIVTNPDQATTNGKLIPFVKAYSKLTGKDYDSTMEEFVSRLEILGRTHPNHTYFEGKLRNIDGSPNGRGVDVTSEGKNQLLGWGGEAVNIAWRDFIFKAYRVLAQERANLQQYLYDRQVVANLGKLEHRFAVEDLTRMGCGPASAEGKVVNAHGALYKAMIPAQFSSATAAVCRAKGLASTPINKKKVRNQTVTANGTQSFHWERGRLINRTRLLMAMSREDYTKCAKSVAKQALDNEECLFRDMNGQPVDDDLQVKLLFDVKTDFARQPAAPSPLAILNNS